MLVKFAFVRFQVISIPTSPEILKGRGSHVNMKLNLKEGRLGSNQKIFLGEEGCVQVFLVKHKANG